MSGTEPFGRFLKIKPKLRPVQAQAWPSPQLMARLMVWQV